MSEQGGSGGRAMGRSRGRSRPQPQTGERGDESQSSWGRRPGPGGDAGPSRQQGTSQVMLLLLFYL